MSRKISFITCRRFRSYEPADQRFFRLHDVRVPRLIGQKTYTIVPDPDGFSLDGTTPYKLTAHSSLDLENLESDMLGEVRIG